MIELKQKMISDAALCFLLEHSPSWPGSGNLTVFLGVVLNLDQSYPSTESNKGMQLSGATKGGIGATEGIYSGLHRWRPY